MSSACDRSLCISLERRLRREQAAIEAIHLRPWWRVGILLRRPWRARHGGLPRGSLFPVLPFFTKGVKYEGDLPQRASFDDAVYAWRTGIRGYVLDWLFRMHDCADPAVACSCSGGFRDGGVS